MAHKFREIHQYTGILDFERGREDRLVPYPWLTDTACWPTGSTSKSTPYRSIDNLVDVFVDIVAKNGCMLLGRQPGRRRHHSRARREACCWPWAIG